MMVVVLMMMGTLVLISCSKLFTVGSQYNHNFFKLLIFCSKEHTVLRILKKKKQYMGNFSILTSPKQNHMWIIINHSICHFSTCLFQNISSFYSTHAHTTQRVQIKVSMTKGYSFCKEEGQEGERRKETQNVYLYLQIYSIYIYRQIDVYIYTYRQIQMYIQIQM